MWQLCQQIFWRKLRGIDTVLIIIKKKTPLYVLGLLNWAIKEGTVGLGLSHPVYIISINVAVSNRMRKGVKCHKEVTGKQAGEA